MLSNIRKIPHKHVKTTNLEFLFECVLNVYLPFVSFFLSSLFLFIRKIFFPLVETFSEAAKCTALKGLWVRPLF